MTQVTVGCLLERLPSPRSALFVGRGEEPAALTFFEYAPRPPLPTYATLARFRKRVSADVQIALVAPRGTFMTPKGPMRPSPELDAGVEWLTRVADILKAFAIVLPTGSELTPGERDRTLLAAFVARLRTKVPTVVIAPRGLWEPEEAAPFAASMGAVYGFDPLEHDAPSGELVYARVKPMGVKSRLSEGHLTQIAERLRGHPRAYVAVESETMLRDMKRLRTVVSGLAELDELDDEEFDDAALVDTTDDEAARGEEGEARTEGDLDYDEEVDPDEFDDADDEELAEGERSHEQDEQDER